jgi:hypothetical protein
MSNKYSYESFAFRLGEEAKHQQRLALKSRERDQLQRKLAQVKTRHQREKATTGVLRELAAKLLESEKIRPLPIPARAKPDLKQLIAKLDVPKPPRLRRRIFREGSVLIVDVPDDESPWSGWVDLPPGSSSSNNSEATGTWDQNDTISLAASAGFGVEAPNGGGTTAAWGYTGRYFSAPTTTADGTLVDWSEATLEVTASPSISWSADWGTNCLAYAAVTIQTQLILQSWDANGNPQPTVHGAPTTLYSIDQNTGGGDPWESALSYSLTLFSAVTPGWSYGAFVQYYIYVQASFGQPTGSWSAGADASGVLTGVLPAMQFYAVTSPFPS